MEKLSSQEKEILKAHREKQQRLQQCNEAVAKTLEKFNARLAIDPNSPIANPQIIITLND